MTLGVSPTGRTDSCYLRARVVRLDTSFLPTPLKTVADSEGSHNYVGYCFRSNGDHRRDARSRCTKERRYITDDKKDKYSSK